MKKKLWLFEPLILILFVLATGFLVATAFLDLRAFYVELAVYLGVVAITLKKMGNIQKNSYAFLRAIGENLDAAQYDSLAGFPIPVLVCSSESGEIVWYNDLFRSQIMEIGRAHV